MHLMRIPLATAVLSVITLTSVSAMDPRVTERMQPANAPQGQASGGFSKTALPGTPGVLNALADENNTLVYVRVSQARYAAYYDEARSRCAMYRGKARATCTAEARMKYGAPLPSPPL